MKLLIIEDSKKLRNSIASSFRQLGYEIDSPDNEYDGLNYALTNSYDGIVLDLTFSTIDGLSVLKKIRKKQKNVNIIILSDIENIEDRIAGLNSGADEYIIKPFMFDDLHTRLLTLIKRNIHRKPPFIKLREVIADTVMRSLSVSGKIINLTPIEYLIIEYLLLNTNQVISFDILTDEIYTTDNPVSRNTLEVHICSIRKKLKQTNASDLLHTKRGLGYYIEQ